MDPSDPSGNTVYIAGANAGIWKTSNFLSPTQPTWQPLTDAGPNGSLEVSTFAFFPRNNDPNQTIVFATTGAGVDGSTGVGLLRSMDGAKTPATVGAPASTLEDAETQVPPDEGVGHERGDEH